MLQQYSIKRVSPSKKGILLYCCIPLMEMELSFPQDIGEQGRLRSIKKPASQIHALLCSLKMHEDLAWIVFILTTSPACHSSSFSFQLLVSSRGTACRKLIAYIYYKKISVSKFSFQLWQFSLLIMIICKVLLCLKSIKVRLGKENFFSPLSKCSQQQLPLKSFDIIKISHKIPKKLYANKSLGRLFLIYIF